MTHSLRAAVDPLERQMRAVENPPVSISANQPDSRKEEQTQVAAQLVFFFPLFLVTLWPIVPDLEPCWCEHYVNACQEQTRQLRTSCGDQG